MAAGYAELLRTPHAARLLTGTLVGRLPNATAAIAIVLFVRAEGGSYTLAGVLAAVYGLAMAVGQPLLGRAVDLFGQPRVMLPAAVVSALGMAAFALVGSIRCPAGVRGRLVAGLLTPPLEGGLRALWPRFWRREDQVHAAYAMDAVAQEVMFTVGPLLVTGSSRCGRRPPGCWSSTPWACWVRCRWWCRGRRGSGGPRRARRTGSARCARRGCSRCSASFFFVGLALGSITVAAVAYADDHGGESSTAG